MKRLRPQPEFFTVGWITALPIEHEAAVQMLDEQYEPCDHLCQYTLGRIGFHHVVIAVLGHMGTIPAATVAQTLISTFPRLQFGFMVGIAGGAPSEVSDIRLGDFVVSKPQGKYGGVVQYDFGKILTGGESYHTGFLNGPPAELLTASSKFQANMTARWNGIQKHLLVFNGRSEFLRQNAGPDILFQPSYNHPAGTTCDQHHGDMMVVRDPRAKDGPVIHFGTVASGNIVVKDGSTRDRLSAKFGGVLCFEMEAAGVMNVLPSLVVRGICDYADSHKHKAWQPVAAATDAACAKEILSFVPRSSRESSITISTTRHEDGVMYSIQPDRENITMELSQQRITYLNQLQFDQIHTREATIETAHSGTCKWLLDRPEYQDWLDATKFKQHHGFLWIKGKPAAGKSTMMKFAFNETRKARPDTVMISFFFHARGDELERSIDGMYRSLLYQLLSICVDLQAVLDILPRASIDANGLYRYEWSFNILRSLFENAVARMGDRPLMLFVDGLDECDEDKIRDMLSFFQQLAERALSDHRYFSVCLSSRHYPHISLSKRIELVLEEQRGHRQDIINYLNIELQTGQSDKSGSIKSEILNRAQGIFLWVVLVVKILNREIDRGKGHTLRRKLKEIPNGLDGLLREIITRDATDTDDMVLCLQWILYAKRPLRPRELYFAVLSEENENAEHCVNWESETSEKDMKRFILNVSKGLAEFTQSEIPTVQFIHESVRDFLLSHGGLDSICSTQSGRLHGWSHDRLKNCCLNYLSIDLYSHLPMKLSLLHSTFSSYIYLSEMVNIIDSVRKKFPFLQYAVQYVFHHAEIAEISGFTQRLFLESFPRERWISVFNAVDLRRYAAQLTVHASLVYIFAHMELVGLLRNELNRAICIESIYEYYPSPLFAALSQGHEEAAKTLLGFQVSAVTDTSLLTNSRHIHLEDHYGRTELCVAAQRGSIEIVKILLQQGADINPQRQDNMVPLFCAVQHGHFDVTRYLIDNGADVDLTCGSYLQPPLYRACDDGNTGIVEMLVESGASPESRDLLSGSTPLSTACRKGHIDVAKALIKYGADMNPKDPDGRSPLVYAVQYGFRELAELLIRNGADISTSLIYVLLERHRSAVKLLVRYGAVLHLHYQDKQSLDHQKTILWAIDEGFVELAIQLLQGGLDPNVKDQYGRTALSQASRDGNELLVKVLVEKAANIDAKDVFGVTPLIWAAKHGHHVIVKLLLHQGADMETRKLSGRTSLFCAAGKGHITVVDLLLQRGAKKTMIDILGKSPLSVAEEEGHEEVARMLRGQ